MRSPLRTSIYLFDAEFFADSALPFGYIRKAGVIENAGNGISHITHHQAQATGLLIGAAARLIGHLADALDRRHWPIQYTEDLAESDLAGLPGQVVPATDAHLAVKHARILECQKNLLKEFGRDLFALRNLFDLHHRQGSVLMGGTRQHDHGP